MKIKSVVIASVSAVFLAAGVAATGPAVASSQKPADLMSQAYANLVSGKAEAAIAGYTAAINHADTSLADTARALLNRALAHQKTGDHAKAIEDYTQAINLDALSPDTRAAALYNRGLAHARSKQHFAAVDDFTSALYLDPHLADAFYSRANVLRESGQYEYALMDYSRADAAGYRHKHLAWYGKALTFAKLGHRDEATAALLKAYGIKPDFKQARERLSELGVDVPANPTDEQIKLAVLPARNLMADDLVTGSTSTAGVSMAKAQQKRAVAPPPALLNGLSPAPAMTLAAADTATPVKPLAKSPEKISAADVGPVPVANKKPAAKVVAKVAPSAATTVKVEPVAAPAPAATNLASAAAPALEKGVSETLEGWTVQLVSQRDADSAWSNWNKLKSRHGKLLNSAEAAVVRADLGDQGIYYRLRVHKLDSKSEASSLCRKLKRRGTSCFVARGA
jgi:tetratricopeptide (TPR) repeat protein